jgi:wyosine [tRNA(Phe)-imidazoG37] synthetase (radical SAM superfamily)
MISFGPVPSRRLGRSLGINNIVAPKICSYSCVYCQVGKTRKQSIDRQEYFKPEVIYKEVSKHLRQINPATYPDYLTFVSNGEPTLDINLGKSIKLLAGFGIPIAVITNASMLFLKSVREDLHFANWVSLKIDAGDHNTWQNVNRPSPGLTFERNIENINLFASEYNGKLCTETMLIEGLNDSIGNITNVSELIKRIEPEKAYLAIPIRPPTEKTIRPPDPEKLNMAWHIFNNKHLDTELLTGFEGVGTGFTGNIYEDILNIAAVHPLREDSLQNLLRNDNADSQVVKSLINQRLIRVIKYNGHKYYLREYHHNI